MTWDFGVVLDNADAIAIGLGNTLLVSVLSIILGTVSGVLLGVGSISAHRIVRVGSRAVVEVFLALPVLVILIWLYYCLPLLGAGLVFSGFTSTAVVAATPSKYPARRCRISLTVLCPWNTSRSRAST